MNSIVLIAITLLFSAFFSGMEIAYISANKLRIELDKKQGHFASNIITLFMNSPGKFLTTMLVGNNIALVTYGLIMAELLRPLIRLESAILVLVIQTIISTLLILMTAEFFPKLIFRSIANTTLKIFALPSLLFYTLFFPVTSFINFISHTIINKFHRNSGSEEESGENLFNKVDIVHLLNEAQENESEESAPDNDLKLFQNALDFSSVRVRDCMVPRTEIVALEKGSAIEELQQTFVETGFSKIMIFNETIDNIIGYVTSKALFKKIGEIEDHVIPIEYIPETMSAHRLLEKFIQSKKSVSVVVDEFGGISGLITIEDIIEEIFGEIEDEHDMVELIEKQINEEEYIFSGRLEIDYLNDKYNLHIPESEDYGTLAGFITHNYEKIPTLNERITIEPFQLKILKASKTKIDLVHLQIVEN